MKRLVTVGAVAAALACLCGQGTAQGVLHRGVAAAPVMAWPGNAQSNVVVIPLTITNWEALACWPAEGLEFKAQPQRRSARLHSPRALPVLPPGVYERALSNYAFVPVAPARVPPGVYRTEPYSCIVVVPGPHPDDQCIIKPGGGEYSMPIITPDLRFIPRSPEKK